MTTLLDTSPARSGPDCSHARCRVPAHRPAHWEIRHERLVISGDLDEAGCPSIRSGFTRALHDRAVEVIDLTDVTFFSAAGVSLLIQFRMQDRFDVVGNALIRRILDLVDCSHLLSDADRST